MSNKTQHTLGGTTMVIYATKDYQEMSRKAANIIASQIILKPASVLGLATGSTPVGAYQQLIEKYNNGELKGEQYKFLSLISLSRKFSEFIDSIINISDILDRHIGMIVIDRDIDLYRGFNAKEGEEKISRSEYISTSTSIDVAKCFIHNDKLYKNSLGDVKQLDKHIVHLKVKAGVPFMIFPFNKEQNEILIFANTLDIKLINKNTKNMYGWYNYIEEEYICSLKKDYKLNLDNISK